MRLYNYILLLMFSALLFGCRKSLSDNLVIEKTEPLGCIRVNMPSAETKLYMDGLVLKWRLLDHIVLLEVAPDNTFIQKHYLSIIRREDISIDGKSAIFRGMELEENKKYVAIHAAAADIIDDSDNVFISSRGFFSMFPCTSLSALSVAESGSYEEINRSLCLISQIVNATNDGLSDFVFRPMESILEFKIRLSSQVKGEHRLKKLRFIAHDNVFAKHGIRCNALGDIVLPRYRYGDGKTNYFDIGVEGEPLLSSSEDYIIRIPVWWNPQMNNSDGEFTITIVTTGGEEMSLKRPAKKLLPGTLYKLNLEFESPQNKAISDREALIAIYNKMEGDKWEGPIENWCSDKPLSEWYGVQLDEDGRVVSLDIECYNIENMCNIPDEIELLDRLERLSIAGNIEGAIPESFKNLHSLMILDLCGPYEDNMGLTDVSALAQCTTLANLTLEGHSLNTDNLNSLSTLENLFWLRIIHCGLEGDFPNFIIPMLSHLSELYTLDNKFTGILPLPLLQHPKWPYFMKRILGQEGSGFNLSGVIFPFPHFVDKDVVLGTTFSSKEVIAKNKLTIFHRWSFDQPQSCLETLRRLYNNYHHLGLEIVSHPFWDDSELLQKYISENPVPWSNLTKYIYPLYTEKFYEPGLLFTVVDANGNIIYDRNLISADHNLENLEMFVKDFFSKI